MNRLNPKTASANLGDSDLQDSALSSQAIRITELEGLIKKFAPIMSFHPEEQSVPVTVEWYLQKAWLVNGGSRSRVPANKNNLPFGSENSRNYYLEPKEGASMFRENEKINAKAYVHARYYNSEYTDLQYWFLFGHKGSSSAVVKWLIDDIMGHEGKINLNPLGKSNGNWERITVRVNNTTHEAEQIFFPRSGEGIWVPVEKVQRRNEQIIVYASKNDCGFYPAPGLEQSEKLKFNLFSSRLEFCFQNEIIAGESVDFSGSCELVSATYLAENAPKEPLWLHFESTWGNPKPEHLTASYIRRIVLSTFGKTLEFLLSRDILEELVDHLLSHFTKECHDGSLTPKVKKCWHGEEN